jgi:hypothetical protein
MRQMMQYNTLEERKCFRGSALVTPSLFQIIDTINVNIQQHMDNNRDRVGFDGPTDFTIRKDESYDLVETLKKYDSVILRLFDRLDITKSSFDFTNLSNFCFAKVQITFIDISTKTRVHPRYNFGESKDEYVQQIGMFTFDLDNCVCADRYKDDAEKKKFQLIANSGSRRKKNLLKSCRKNLMYGNMSGHAHWNPMNG